MEMYTSFKNEPRTIRLRRLHQTLCDARESFRAHWRIIADNLAPRKPRWYTEDVNRGDRRNQKIIDNSPVLALRTLRSGMMSGITSPARPWFRLTLGGSDEISAGPVKSWLDQVTDLMNSVFLRSNLYNILPIVYGDLGSFGTAAMLVEEDFDNVARFYSVPLGSYCLALSDAHKVEVFTREFRMTVRQLITRFGMVDVRKDQDDVPGITNDRDGDEKIDWSKFSVTVRNMYDNDRLEDWVDVLHVITPNEYFDEQKLDAKYKKFRSTYMEKGTYCGGHTATTQDLGSKVLRDSGYDYFPVLAPRWETTGEDVYATSCPGMDALGDILQLQAGERRIAQAIELLVRPPMVGSASLQSSVASIIPGKITYVDERSEGKGFRPAFQVDPRVNELEGKQQQIRQRISRTFFEDLFLMLSQSDRRQITAREIDERHEEKLLALGPVLEQLNQDLLDPLIDIVFDFMMKRGLIPQPPDELKGQDLRVEYISIMQQAQKLAGLSAVERFTQFVMNLAQADPSVLMKVDTMELVDNYGDITSMRAGIIRSDEDVAQMKQQQAQAQAQQAQMQQLQQGAEAAKNLSQTDMNGNNALNQLLQQTQAGRIA